MLRLTLGRTTRSKGSASLRNPIVYATAVPSVPFRSLSISSTAPFLPITPRTSYASICGVPKRTFATVDGGKELLMPALSPTMTTGGIAEWKKKEGDKVNPGDVLCGVVTDKATMDMEATEDQQGYLAKILVPAGTTDIKISEPIAILVEDKADVAKFANYKAAARAAAPQEAAPAPAQPQAPAPAPAAPAPAAPQPVPAATKAPQAAPQAAPVAPLAAPQGLFTDIPHSNIRKITAQRLTQAKQTIPHYYLTIDCRVDKLLSLRQELNAKANGAYKLSVNDFIVKASALALRKVPAANSSWSDTAIRRYNFVDICVAVNTDLGLFTPIVKDADKKGLATIANNVKELAEKAKANKLKPEEFQGGTFTISNLGMFGIKQFAAVINPPQACILAVGTTEQRVILNEKAKDGESQYTSGNFMSVTLSCDHRVVDGAIGAEWLSAFREFIEDPVKMLL